MDFQEIVAVLKEKLSEEELVVEVEHQGDPFIRIPTGKLVELLSLLKEEEKFAFDCLSNLTGVDAPPDDLDVVYHYYSYDSDKRHSLTLKVRVPKSAAKVPTLCQVYPTADWLFLAHRYALTRHDTKQNLLHSAG